MSSAIAQSMPPFRVISVRFDSSCWSFGWMENPAGGLL